MQSRIQQPLSYTSILHKRNTFLLWMLLLAAILLLSILLAVCLGVVKIAPKEAYQIMIYKIFHLNIGNVANQVSAAHQDIIWQIRFPRVLMAAIAGAGLAMCGAAMQASVQNPLADPFIMGISSGASLGATFSILIGSSGILPDLSIAGWAFAGALAASSLVLFLSSTNGQMSTIKTILSGVIANSLFSAFSGFIIYLANNAEGIRTVTFWTMGSFSSAKWSNITLPAIGLVLCGSFFLSQSRHLNALLLGEEAATTLGIDLSKVRRRTLIATAFATGFIVAACGVIGFVGLIIPHIVRSFVGSDHRRLIPSVILAGAIFLTWADVLARTILPSGELPIGIITALLGAPFFMYVLFTGAFGFAR